MHPNRIGPYLIEKRIGSGGMANVYLARHEQTNQIVAVKELPASLAREEGFIHRFDREIEALQKLNCPNIVKLFDSGQDGEIYYYAMEYVDGETLTTRLRRERRIPWQEAIEISRQICVGLKHAHDAGVIHRDLKPSNLMLGKEGVVKITDFGVAQVFAADRLTATGGIIGTAEFMSPEQVKGSRIDKRSDLYSLGAVLYTMLVGQPPFTGPTASDIMHKQRFARFDPPKNHVPEIPGWLNEIVCQLLEKEPDKRPPDAFVTS
ncbi:MAG: serine/threonine protein kinase, partial [Planctomycetota bacterium]